MKIQDGRFKPYVFNNSLIGLGYLKTDKQHLQSSTLTIQKYGRQKEWASVLCPLLYRFVLCPAMFCVQVLLYYHSGR